MKGQFFPYRDENVSKSTPYVTYILIAANIVAFVISMADFENIIFNFGFIPAEAGIITIFTSIFLHGGVDHIFGNMWFLWIFGDNVEDRMGKVQYTIFYFLSGLAATFAHYITNIGSVVPAIGASGAISGVLGAYLAMFPGVRVHVASKSTSTTMPAWTMLGLWFFMQLIFGITSLAGGEGSGIASGRI